MSTYLKPNTPVAIRGKRGVTFADGHVVEHTDDSDEYMANPEQWITVRIAYSETPALKVGDVVKFRRGLRDFGRTWHRHAETQNRGGPIHLGAVSIEVSP